MGVDEGVLSIQPQIPEISVGNQMERTISVRSDQNIWDYLWRWSVYFERSGHFGWLDWNVPFHLTNCCPKSTAPLYPACKNNQKTRGGLGRVRVTGMYRSIWHVEFPKFQTGIFVEWKAHKVNDNW